RMAAGDPRPAVQERYQSVEDYLGQMKKYCDKMVQEGYLLPGDVSRILEIQGPRVAPLFEKTSAPE
ncbi:MAG: hypothetical protein GY917_14365, partial [Planctomycetaceae bacterium]|nr:hypothetical protein [Planctomycetaceae bacterium]